MKSVGVFGPIDPRARPAPLMMEHLGALTLSRWPVAYLVSSLIFDGGRCTTGLRRDALRRYAFCGGLRGRRGAAVRPERDAATPLRGFDVAARRVTAGVTPGAAACSRRAVRASRCRKG